MDLSTREDCPVRSFCCSASIATLLTAACFGSVHAQKLTLSAGPPPANAPVADRRGAMNAYFQQYWDAYLEHDPEFASEIGDKRFNDKISDYSVKAMNAWLEQ